ncbi:MAG: DUF805 domain-containing protein, partial [Lysobacter sp.]|nr:DUF805 domain-containing protein [Lysobacter sp.]
MYWYMKVLRNYVGFSGRARRKEYWMFTLINILVVVGLMLIDMAIGTFDKGMGMGLLMGIYLLAGLIPSIAVGVRRMHDHDKSGWAMLTKGHLLAMEGTQGENRFGPDPKTEPHGIP